MPRRKDELATAHWQLITAITVVTLLLVARGATSASQRAELVDGDKDNDNDQDVGASRGWGGNNKTEHLKDFPWLAVLFRNPDDQHKTPPDGYPTGYALELQHNLFLMRNTAQVYASKGGWPVKRDMLMALVRAKDLVVLDPTRSRWPPDGTPGLGNISLKMSIGWDFGIYRVRYFEPELNLAPFDDGTGYYFNGFDLRKHLPAGTGPPADGSRVLRYPLWNDDVNLASNCYVYKFSPPDYSDIARAAADEYGLPPGLYNGSVTKFPEDELRHFVRAPVKLAIPCDKYKRCVFVFDDERYQEEHVQGKYSARRARVCGHWQDVGAPIMCGDKPPLHKGFSPQGVYYERMYLRLSYIVQDSEYSTRAGCTDNIIAQRLADYENEVRPMLDKIKRALYDERTG